MAGGQQGAVVADAQAKAALRCVGARCPLANLRKQGEFALSAYGSEMGLLYPHLMRIGQPNGTLTG